MQLESSLLWQQLQTLLMLPMEFAPSHHKVRLASATDDLPGKDENSQMACVSVHFYPCRVLYLSKQPQ